MDAIDGSSNRLTFSGLASGLDTGSIVEALIDFERRPLTLMEARKSDLETSQTLLQNFNQLLLNLREAARAVDNLSSGLTGPSATEELLAFQATSSDEALIEVEASSDAQPGIYQVRVDAVAASARRVSSSVADPDASLSNNRRIVQIDYGDAGFINIRTPRNVTLNELRDLINTDVGNDGSVRADILFDGSGYRLTVAGVEPGASNDVTIATNLPNQGGSPFIDTALGQDASDAQLQYLGIPITRASNDIVDLIPGVTLRLRGANDPATPGETVEIDVARDDEAIAEKLTALVDAYNAVRDFSIEQSKVDPTSSRGGLLSGDALVRGVEQTLQLTLGGLYTFTDNPLGSIGQLGISFDAAGRLSLDDEAMRAALDTDPLAVRQLLSGDGTNDGAASALARALEPIIRSGDGTLAQRDSTFDERIDDLERQIERFEARLEKREETLILQFSRLETLISSLQGQASFLASLTVNNGNGNG